MRTLRCLALVCALAPLPVLGQSPDTDPRAVLSADSVKMAEEFELRVEVPVPEGSVVFFPDVVTATDYVESRGPVDWRARRGPDGGATVELRYPLIPFGMGTTPLPPIDIITMPREDGVDGEGIPGRSIVGAWDDREPLSRYTRRITPPPVWVEPVYTSEDVVGSMSPRGPGDVLGSSWSWPSMALVLLFSTVAAGAVSTTTREWLAGRAERAPPGPAPIAPDEARRRALADLDGLIAAGPYPGDRARELYERSSGIVRGYVERFDPAWGPELTSMELMERLALRHPGGAAPIDEMRIAEAVKFGRHRPSEDSSAAHLAALRAWVAGGPEARA